jgi:hypothetical protein
MGQLISIARATAGPISFVPGLNGTIKGSAVIPCSNAPKTNSLEARSAAQILRTALRGQTVTVPNLWPSFAKWPQGINVHYERLVKVVDDKLERYVPL